MRSATRHWVPVALVAVGSVLSLSASCSGSDSVSGLKNGTPQLPAGPHASARIGPTGGVVGFNDGRFKLTIPAGAIPNDTTITVTEISGSDIPPELQDTSVLKVYDLQPDGLVFTTPATVELHTEGSAAVPDSAPLIGLISDHAGTLALLTPLTGTVDSTGITTTAAISHFSSVAKVVGEGIIVSLAASPSSLPVHSNFDVTLAVTKSSNSETPAQFHTYLFSSDTAVARVPESLDPASFSLTPGETQTIKPHATGTCESQGMVTVSVLILLTDPQEASKTIWTVLVGGSVVDDTAAVDFRLNAPIKCTAPPPPSLSGLTDLTVGVFQSGFESLHIDAASPITVTTSSSDQSVLPDASIVALQGCTAAGSCTILVVPQAEGTATVTVTVTDADGQTATGTFKVTTGSSAKAWQELTVPSVEGINFRYGKLPAVYVADAGGGMATTGDGSLLATFGSLPMGVSSYAMAGNAANGVLVAGSDGLYGYDGTLPMTMMSPVPMLPLTLRPEVSGRVTDIFDINDNDVAAVLFVLQQIAIYHGQGVPLGNRAADPGPGVSTASATSGGFVYDQTLADAWTVGGQSIFGTDQPVSAYVGPNGFTASDPILAVTVANDGSGASKLLKLDLVNGKAVPTEITSIALPPEVRQIRCLQGICAVSSYGTGIGIGGMTYFRWDGQSTFTPVTGGGFTIQHPIGIDLIATGANSVLVAATDFDFSGAGNDLYLVDEISLSGQVLSSLLEPVPAGCLGAGHIAFRSATEVLIGCNISGSVVSDSAFSTP